MKTFKIFLALIAISLSVTTLSGASSPQTPFSLTVSTETPVVKAGSDVWIKIKMTNTSNHDIDCSSAYANGLDRRYQYDVRDLSGHSKAKVGQHPEMSAGSIVMCTLKPGESTDPQDNRISWLQDFSQPGKYIVQVSRGASDNEKDGVVRSNKVEITVEP